jgi:hypothetical protein
MSRAKLNVRQQQFGFPDEDLKTSLHDEIVLWLKKNAETISQRFVERKSAWSEEDVRAGKSRIESQLRKLKAKFQTQLEERQKDPASDEYWREQNAKRIREYQEVIQTIENWNGLGAVPIPHFDLSTQLEVPIKRQRYQTTDIIGYADVVYRIEHTSLSSDELPTYNGELLVHPPKVAGLLAGLRWLQPLYSRTIAFDAKTTIPSLGELIRQLQTYRTYCDWPFYIVSLETRFAEAIAEEGFGFMQYPEGLFLKPSPRR